MDDMNIDFTHIPIMLKQCLDGLNIREDKIYLDGTAGGAGHSSEIAKCLTTGKLVALDQDPDAIIAATQRLKDLPAVVCKFNFKDADKALDELNIDKIDGALLDLGVSSHQLDKKERGFSYNSDAPLDMRMSQQGETAADLVNNLSRQELANILREYGEESYAWQIAGKIEAERQINKIETTKQLADIVISAFPPAIRRKSKNPARKTFQAIRIAVNMEMDVLSQGLETIFQRLNKGGRFCIITFHSIEDRIVKRKFKEWCEKCTCPQSQLICTCGGVAKAVAITRKPLVASPQEQEQNRRSRSAKLRIIEKQ